MKAKGPVGPTRRGHLRVAALSERRWAGKGARSPGRQLPAGRSYGAGGMEGGRPADTRRPAAAKASGAPSTEPVHTGRCSAPGTDRAPGKLLTMFGAGALDETASCALPTSKPEVVFSL